MYLIKIKLILILDNKNTHFLEAHPLISPFELNLLNH